MTAKIRDMLPGEEPDIPKTLYKYRIWDNEWHRRILTDQEIYFAPASKFEDPLDCKNPTRYDLLNRKELSIHIEQWLRRTHPTMNRSERRQKAKEISKQKHLKDKKYILEFEQNYWYRWDKMNGVLCLTANSENEYMWENYADDHKGFCVGFNAVGLHTLKMNMGPVRYQTPLPTIYPEPKMNSSEAAITQVFFKEKKWEFEDEFRASVFSTTGLNLSEIERTKVVPKEYFQEVILGKNMSEKNKSEISELVLNQYPNVEIIDKSES